MKYLGIDFGSKNVGLAVSDQAGQMAFPKDVLFNDKNLLKNLVDLIKKEKIEGVVFGESVDYAGSPNKIMTELNAFVEQLKKEIDIPIFFEPEFMTSLQAIRLQGKNEMLDASAATIILQSYLDKLN